MLIIHDSLPYNNKIGSIYLLRTHFLQSIDTNILQLRSAIEMGALENNKNSNVPKSQRSEVQTITIYLTFRNLTFSSAFLLIAEHACMFKLNSVSVIHTFFKLMNK